MKLTYHDVPPDLQPYIERIWQFESPQTLHKRERAAVIPNGRCVMIWNYKGGYCHHLGQQTFVHDPYDLHLIGQHTQALTLVGSEPVYALGITFRAYGYYAFLDDGDAIPTAVVSFTPEERIRYGFPSTFDGNSSTLVENVIHSLRRNRKRQPSPWVTELAHAIEHDHGKIPIGLLMEGIPVSQRHLNKLFKIQVGLTPKTFASIVRFRRVYNDFLRDKSREKKTSLYDYYYDESHFIQDFKRIFMTKPKAFLEQMNALGNQFIIR
ncbi:helix-turn-helix protein [Sphingobacterium allocomposti]|uniref:Helix-turn-helix protein n=1 Tax=Sphingobacterium allocomposti TaxID=415956 RepID=A0A5S5DME0_9SPHI|nr:DUF6597 domain-containing transcriptional factor [Sphingobacterium composti Yoo et al. 2007 non Ten et al. 2007]TYP96558.1 helix-turn-helix protein [Sphingobacterium composti Yoo et al. 2007 non Ten et al. 2007]